MRRLIFATRVALALEILAAAVLLHLELAVSNALVWPGYGAARPVAAMLVGFVAWFVNSHPCFRWLVRAGDARRTTGVSVCVVCVRARARVCVCRVDALCV